LAQVLLTRAFFFGCFNPLVLSQRVPGIPIYAAESFVRLFVCLFSFWFGAVMDTIAFDLNYHKSADDGECFASFYCHEVPYQQIKYWNYQRYDSTSGEYISFSWMTG
jgi:hypothetical protein